MTFHCHACGWSVGNVKSASCSKHGPLQQTPTPSTAPVRSTFKETR